MDRELPSGPGARPVALVTGGCSGIGKAIARRLGALGYELVLVSQRPAELRAAAEEIEAASGTPAHALPLDLARPEAAAELHAEVRSRGLEVDVLVNNAGMFFFGEVADAALPRANALLQLHVVTPSLLCTLFGRDMRERRRGHVLIVSSISAWRDFPGIAYYGSSKKYLRGFARSLRSELGVYGVNVTCLAPGATATALYDPSVVPVGLARRLGVMMDADQVAEAGLRLAPLPARSASEGLWRASRPVKGPRPGDLAFFHDTFDRDGDGRRGDRFTHVALVEAVDGPRVVLIHRGSRGIQRLAMNLARRHDPAENGWLRKRRAGDPPGGRFLSGELFAAYGTAIPAEVAQPRDGFVTESSPSGRASATLPR